MIPTFVIGLREGLEAALIVGIVAAFLDRRERRDALKWMWLGVLSALATCGLFAWALHLTDDALPQAQQEGLETVISVLAVGMVTYMIMWMKQHSRDIKHMLEHSASGAIARGSVGALVAMAFLAVLREGIETAVFLLAIFQTGATGAGARVGVVLGIAVAAAIGYGIYRGSVRINLSRVFRITGVALVLVAGGLVASALHTAHEAGWINAFQSQALDLSWVIRPGSVRGSLITGLLGIHPQPTVAELVGWLLYVVPMGMFVVWPKDQRMRNATGPIATVVIVGAVALLLGS